MAWSKNRVLPEDINENSEFTKDDNLTVDELNAIVNNSFYGVDFVEAMADAPDVSDAGNVGTPSVTLVDNIKNGKIYKKFKFSNLKGEKGEKGEQGDKGAKGDKGDSGATGSPNTLTIGSVTSGTTASATITGTAPNQILNLVLPKGDKGDPAESGVEISSSGTNYIRYSDGLQICWGDSSNVTSAGAIPVSVKPFVDEFYGLSVSIKYAGDNWTNGTYIYSKSTASFKYYKYSSVSASVSWIAVGRWK